MPQWPDARSEASEELERATRALPPENPSLLGPVLRLVAHPDDMPEDTLRKRRALTISLVVAVIGAASTAYGVGLQDEGLLVAAGGGIQLVASIITFVYMTVSKDARVGIIEGQLYACVLSLVLFEMSASHNGTPRVWPFFALVGNVLLMLQMGHTHGVLGIGVLVLALLRLHNLFDMGIPKRTCSCDTNPGSDVLHEVPSFVFEMAFILADFRFMQIVSSDIADERHAGKCSTLTAQLIAKCLAHFDLDAAEQLLQEHSLVLSPGLLEAFNDVLENLRMYQPYLSLSCLPVAVEEAPPAVIIEGDGKKDMVDDDPSLLQSRRDRASVDTAGPANEHVVWSEDQFVSALPAEWGRRLTENPTPKHRASKRASELVPSACPGGEQEDASAPGTKWRLVAAAARATCLHLKTSRISLLMTNIHSSLRRLDDFVSYELEFSGFLLNAIERSADSKGIVDWFAGDRVFLSFNASRPCATHAHAAVTVAKQICNYEPFENAVNMAIVTGKAVCGDLGCRLMYRFSILGMPTLLLSGYERVARLCNLPVVCNSNCERDANVEHGFRLVLRRASFQKRCPVAPCRNAPPDVQECNVWAVDLPPLVDSLTVSKEDAEWMYALDVSSRKWAAYNEAARSFLAGKPQATVLQHLATAPEGIALQFREALKSPVASIDPLSIHL